MHMILIYKTFWGKHRVVWNAYCLVWSLCHVPNSVLINTLIIMRPCYLLRASKWAAHVNYDFDGRICCEMRLHCGTKPQAWPLYRAASSGKRLAVWQAPICVARASSSIATIWQCFDAWRQGVPHCHLLANKQTNKLHGLSPRANYTDRATAACRRSDCQLLRIESATWSA
jgi:hypothetical protein